MRHQPSPARPARLEGVEGLRAIAAFAVLAYHVWLYGDPSRAPVDVGGLQQVFLNLQGAVTLFFTLSGFLLFRPYAAAVLNGRPAPRAADYLRNRALRILPAYWVVLLVTAVAFDRRLLDAPLKLLGNAGFAMFSVPGWVSRDLDAGGSDAIAIVPAWSLAVEVAFYLVLPLLGLLALRLGRRARPGGRGLLAAALAPALVLLGVGIAAKIAFRLWFDGDAALVWGYSFPMHADWFSAGMAVAVLRVRWEAGALRLSQPVRWGALVAAVGLVLAATKAYAHGTLNGVEFQTPVALACGLVLMLVVLPRPGSRVVRLLGSRVAVAAGLASYSVFLWHDPLLRELRDQGLLWSGRSGLVLNLVVVAVLTALLSAASYRLVERPALALKRRSQAPGPSDPEPMGSLAEADLELPAPRVRRRALRPVLEGAVAAAAGSRRDEIAVAVPRRGGGRARVDQRALALAVEELVRNGLMYGSGPIRVSGRRERELLRVTVEDAGRGVQEEFVPYLFEPSTRSEQSSSAVPGRGLGLARARAAARRCGGDIAYRSAAGGGACFELALPVSTRRRRGAGASPGVTARGWSRALRRALVAMAALAGVVAAVVAAALLLPGLAGAASAATSPSAMAGLGDSLTRGFGSAGVNADNPAGSWATGSDTAVSSHYQRLLAQGAPIAGRNFNDAVSGSTMAATYAQAASAVSQGAGYVTVWSGTNDACATTAAGMTPVATYQSGLQATLARLAAGLPGARILVVSVPDWLTLWQHMSGNPSALSAWASYGDRCPILTATGATPADRSAFAQRIADYNAAQGPACAAVPGCVTDGGAVFRLWSALTPTDLAFDWFHLSLAGQAKVAAATWPLTPWAGGSDPGSGGSDPGSGGSGGTATSSFGNAVAGSVQVSPGPNAKFGSIFTAPESGTATGFRWYVRGGSASQAFRPVVYAVANGAPTTLLAAGAEVTVAAGRAPGWVSSSVPSFALTGGQSYLLGLLSGANANGAFNYAATVGGAGLWNGNAYPTPAATWGASNTEGYRWSFLLDYTPAGSSTPTATAPAATSAPAIAGTAQEGQTLTATTGSWSGSPTPAYSEAWQRCSSSGTSCTGIAGASGLAYTVTAADVGSTLRVAVTASNSAGSATATSAATAVVVAASSSGGGGGSVTRSLGNAVVGSLTGSAPAGYKYGGVYAASEAGSVSGFRFYARGGGASQSFRVLVYSVSGGVPGSLLAVGPEVTVAAGQAAGWVSSSLPSFSLVAGAQYWIGLLSGPNGSKAANFAVGVAGANLFNANAYPTPSSSFGPVSVDNNQWALLLDYTPAG